MRIAGVIIAFVALIVGGLLFMSYENTKKQVAKLENQVSQQHQQISSLNSQLEQAHEDLRTQKTEIESRIEDLHDNVVQPLKDRVSTLEANPTLSLKVAFINVEDAFSVFTDAVSDLRQRAIDKQGEIVTLQQQYMSGVVSKNDFDSHNNQLQVELLQAQLNIDLGTIDKMIASTGFSDIKSDLQRLKDEAQPLVDEMKNLVSTVRVGVIDTTEFQNRYTQVKNAFMQVDQLLTQAATAKIVQAANKVAVDKGYDLVLRTKNVIVYRNTAKMTDITDLVKRELSGYL